MIVTINGKAVAVKFQHTNIPENRSTKCIIVDGKDSKDLPDTDFIGVGYAKVHPKDNFCKAKGRKVALSKALDDAGYTKLEKEVFWTIYSTWGIKRF